MEAMRFTSRWIRWSTLAVLAVAIWAVLIPLGVPANNGNAVTPLPANVTGTTSGGDHPSGAKTSITCVNAKDVAWYRFAVARRGPVLVDLKAAGSLDAVVAVFRERRSGIGEVGCRPTDQHGKATLAIWGKPKDMLLVGVGRRANSASGTFALKVIQAEPPATPPGTPVTSGRASGSLDALLNADDAWSVQLTAGQPFRINLLSQVRNQCLQAALYPPETVSFDEGRVLGEVYGCDGHDNYLLFTAGPDGGGVYTLHVTAAPDVKGPQPYRLITGTATADDSAPGIELQNGADVRGSLFGRGVDAVDLYSFSVTTQSIFRAELLTKPGVRFDLDLLGHGGSGIGTPHDEGPGSIVRFRELGVGLYYLAVRSHDRSGGQYELQLSVREFTTTQMAIDGVSKTESAPDISHLLTATVMPPGFGGEVRFQLDRFDPLSGWQFVGFVTAPVAGNGAASTSWTPSSTGSWRIRARFMGTLEASVSQSGPVSLYVGPQPNAQ